MLVSICLLVSCTNILESNNEKEAEQPTRVKQEWIGNGVVILTIDNHEYIHYRDGNNAASVGGIIHKFDCKYCIQK